MVESELDTGMKYQMIKVTDERSRGERETDIRS